MAAFLSLLCFALHFGQIHSRTSKGRLSMTKLHTEQVLLDGNHLSTLITVLPYHFALYSICLTNSDKLTSAMDLASL